MSWRICLIALLSLLARQAAAANIVAPVVGQDVTARVLFLNGTVLLPPGQWIVASSIVKPAAEIDGADMASIVLLQADRGQVSGVVLAQANVTPLKSRPSLSSDCWSEQAVFTALAADDDSGGACTAVMPIATQLTPGDNSAWNEALAFAKARDWLMPRGFMISALRSVDRSRIMDVRYALAVPHSTSSSGAAACAWAASDPQPTPEMQHMAQGMTNFATAMLAIAETAGHSQLPEMGPAPPMLAGTDAPKDLMQRFKQARIDELVERGSVSEAQAEVLSKRAAEPTPSDPLIKELLWRSGYKTLTYKTATYIDTTAIYYFFVPDLPLVMVASAITNVLGMPIVYINDFAWSYFGLKASRSKQPFALASLGNACPRT